MPTDQKVTGLSPVGVTKKHKKPLANPCRRFFLVFQSHTVFIRAQGPTKINFCGKDKTSDRLHSASGRLNKLGSDEMRL